MPNRTRTATIALAMTLALASLSLGSDGAAESAATGTSAAGSRESVTPAGDDDLSEEMAPLGFLMGHDWLGHFSAPEAAHIEHHVSWHPILGGSAVREFKRVPELDFTMETLYFWDPVSERIEFVRVTNRGQLGTGTARSEGGRLVLEGTNMDSEGRAYRMSFEVKPDGTLEDRFDPVEPIPGTRGHVIVYSDAGRAVVEEERGTPGDMVLIPAGSFMMGEEGGQNRVPVHEVRIDAFYMDVTEVTNAQYLAFCTETERALPFYWGKEGFRSGPDYPDHPVVGISWYAASAYAEWCGKRLPTEAEWEYAARGGSSGTTYPWGDTIRSSDANYTKAELEGAVPVANYEPNGFGLHDMSGNVGEWASDWYARGYYSASPEVNPAGPDVGDFKVIRGGGWHSGPGCVAVHYRNAIPSNWLDFNVGFRCAKDAGGTSD